MLVIAILVRLNMPEKHFAHIDDVLNVNSDIAKINKSKGIVVAVYGRTQLRDIDLLKTYESLAKKLLLPDYKSLQVPEKKKEFSSGEVDWSSRTQNGFNVFFFVSLK